MLEKQFFINEASHTTRSQQKTQGQNLKNAVIINHIKCIVNHFKQQQLSGRIFCQY